MSALRRLPTGSCRSWAYSRMYSVKQQKDATGSAGLDPENDAGPKGTGGVAAGAMPEMPPEAQPNSSEPPFQRPPMWHPQVPPQESNFNAEQLVPPQVPARASDGKRYPEPLQDGVDTTPDDPEPRADVVRGTVEPVAAKFSADAALNR